MNKSCNHCARGTYRVRGWWTDSEVSFVCRGCNIEEDGCECPKLILATVANDAQSTEVVENK